MTERTRRRPAAMLSIIAAVAVALGVAGCGPAGTLSGTGGAGDRSPDRGTGDRVVTLTGLGGIQFGVHRDDLVQRHGMQQSIGDCHARFPADPEISPVFADDRLVLLWVNPPINTPDQIMVGTPVATVRSTYPGAEELRAPPRSYRFDGLLVTSGDRAYLFLHDGAEVQKVVVGFEEHARKLFDHGFGTC